MNCLLRCGQVWHVSKLFQWTVSHLFCIREVIGQGVSNKVETRSQFYGCELKLTKTYCTPWEERNGHTPKDWTGRSRHKYITCKYIIWPMKESAVTECLMKQENRHPVLTFTHPHIDTDIHMTNALKQSICLVYKIVDLKILCGSLNM